MIPDTPVPVFVISFNRSAVLERCVAGLQNQSVAVDLVVQDNGSDDEATLAALDRLEASGIAVYRRGPIDTAEDLENVEATIRDRIGEPGHRPDFVVTDCDVDLIAAGPEALGVYAWLLEKHPTAHCVGPMLTIADIPEYYPLRQRALQGHIEQFWHRMPEVEDSPFGLLASIPAPIDTTLALHRGGEPFRRLRMGRRVYHPYEARHLDWYLTPDELRQGKPEGVSHWSSQMWLEREKHVSAGTATYFTVDRSNAHELTINKRHATDPPTDPANPRAATPDGLRAAYEEAKEAMARIHRDEIAHVEAQLASTLRSAEDVHAKLDRTEANLARSRRRTRMAVAACLGLGAVAAAAVAVR